LLSPNLRLPILQGRLRGKRWIVGAATHGCWLGSYEDRKQELFARAVKPGSVVFDIGANVGFYSLLASVCTGHQGRVLAFEPVPRNITYLRRHMEMNHLQNVEVIEAAVSDRTGESSFEEGRNPSIGRLEPSGRLHVRTVALDPLVEAGAIPPPDIMKIDIEGGEADALRGARRTLEVYRPDLFLATHGRHVHEECCALLSTMGYEIRVLGDDETRDELIATHPSRDAGRHRSSGG
jgi:FkbM family methyltransferase